MRRIAPLAAALVACSNGDTAASDTASDDSLGTAAPAAAAAPLSAGEFVGSWSGRTTAEGTDSLISRWTGVLTETTAALVDSGSTDTTRYQLVYAGDSMVATSEPYPAEPGGPRVRVRAVGRRQDGAMGGTAVVVLADRPDSVLSRSRWVATRVP